MNQQQRREFLIQYMLKENEEHRSIRIPEDEESQKRLLRGVFNVRPAAAATTEFLQIQDDYLQEELSQRGIVTMEEMQELEKNIFLWRGDITRLKVGAIVNAANSAMQGCFYPNHGCIDNAIHTFAGVQLRQDCAAIMQAQGTPEETGKAKITRAYNLPSDYVLHTVGPIITGELTQHDRDLLRDCYRSCLELAEENSIESVAFCCISTGEFHFPNDEAAKIAVETVREFLQKNKEIKVIFNVFKELDEQLYRSLLG